MSVVQAVAAIFRNDVVPVLRCSITSGVAPLGVVFDGANTSSDVQNFSDLLYYFDYGDTSAPNYLYGNYAGQTKNKQVGGPEGTYVYTAAGTYTARMWVYDGTTVWGPISQTITVTNPDTVYSGTNTICISSSGDFTGAPSGATQITSSSWNTNVSTYLTTGKRVLFRAGETFTAASSTGIGSGKNNVYVGSFGAGARPVIQCTANDLSLITFFANGGNPANNPFNVRIENLDFQGNGTTGCDGISAVGTGGSPVNIASMVGNYVIHNCNFDYIKTPLSFNNLKNLVVNRCTFTFVNGGVQTNGPIGFYFAGFYQCGLTDCNFNNNGGGEHTARFQGGQIAAVISSEFRGANAPRQLFTLRGSSTYETNDVTVAGNIIDATGTTLNWASTIAPQNNLEFEPISKVIVEANYFIAGNGSSQQAIYIQADYIHIRNCIFHIPTASTQNGMIFSTLNNNSTVGLNSPENVAYKYNTFFNEKTEFLAMGVFTATSKNTQIYGNIGYAPGATANAYTQAPPVVLVVNQAGGETTTGNNTTDGGVTATNPSFVGPTTSVAGFQINTGSPYINAGTNIRVYTDARGKLRNSGGQWDTGAVNSPGKQIDAWTLIP